MSAIDRPDLLTTATSADHPSTFIAEELEARGWDRESLARRMGGDAGENALVLDMYFVVGPTDPRMRLGRETAEQLATAFGVSPDYFLNLEAAWLRRAVQ